MHTSPGLSWTSWLPSGKESTCQCRRHRRLGFDPWVGKTLWRWKWQPTPVFLPGKSQDRGALRAAVHGVAESGHGWAAEQQRGQRQCRHAVSSSASSSLEAGVLADIRAWSLHILIASDHQPPCPLMPLRVWGMRE